MTRAEFVERTGYIPKIWQPFKSEDDVDEYDFIEISYQISNLTMDQFCEEWVREYNAGFWKKELEYLVADRMARKRFRSQWNKIRELEAKIESLKDELRCADSENERLRDLMSQVWH